MEVVRLEELRQDYADCRGDLRHAWTRTRVDQQLPDAGQDFYWSQYMCSRCDTRRTLLISDRTGEVVKRRYDYPDGYKLDEKVTIGQLRVEWRRRQLISANRRSRRKK